MKFTCFVPPYLCGIMPLVNCDRSSRIGIDWFNCNAHSVVFQVANCCCYEFIVLSYVLG